MRLIAIATAVALVSAATAARAATSRPADSGVALGTAAPDFAIKNQDGKDVKLSDYKGKIVVLQWLDPRCPFVQRHYEASTFVNLDNKWSQAGVVHIAIQTGGSVAVNKEFHERQKLKFNVLSDADGAVAKK